MQKQLSGQTLYLANSKITSYEIVQKGDLKLKGATHLGWNKQVPFYVPWEIFGLSSPFLIIQLVHFANTDNIPSAPCRNHVWGHSKVQVNSMIFFFFANVNFVLIFWACGLAHLCILDSCEFYLDCMYAFKSGLSSLCPVTWLTHFWQMIILPSDGNCVFIMFLRSHNGFGQFHDF